MPSAFYQQFHYIQAIPTADIYENLQFIQSRSLIDYVVFTW